MDIVHPAVERYLHELAAVDDEPVLLEMEARADAHGFPIIGRLCGRTLEVLARAIDARRIFELGSGFGYSAYWFSRATGPGGEIHLTDTDPANEKAALDFLDRAGLAGPIHYHVADALEAFAETDGEFDIVYCDIDKGDYPKAWAEARDRIRVGGFYISDNMLWSGRVTGEPIDEPDERLDAWTGAIDSVNRAIEADPAYRATIIPTRDGVMAAIRVE
jgi:caffeoyl-CoA O-methyltransferase